MDFNGFLPTRASWMLDFVVLAMVFVTIVMFFSIYLVRTQKNPWLHRVLQVSTAAVLLLALIAFEIDVRFFTNWRSLAEASPYYASGVVGWSLFVHLLFAIPTPLAWGFVIFMALTKFKHSFQHKTYNRIHRATGWLATIMMCMTSVTGWCFYYLAFVA